MTTSLTTTDSSKIDKVNTFSQDGKDVNLEHHRYILATGDTDLASKHLETINKRYGDESAAEINEEIQQEANEKLTKSIDNETMTVETTNNKIKHSTIVTDRALLWTILGAVISFYALMVTIVYSSNSQNVTTMQAIREETVAKVSENNSKVLSAVQGLSSDMQNFRSEINQKFEMQDLKTENKILKDKKSK
jgi:hypothetical protein